MNHRRDDQELELDYWLRMIRSFGGEDTPVIVVPHKQKVPGGRFDVNRAKWLERYPNIRAFVQTDCVDGPSMEALSQKIREEFDAMPDVRAPFKPTWVAIKRELAETKSDYIRFETYREVCARHVELEPEKQEQLARFLHNLGIALNYREDPRLQFAHVLKPQWVT